MRSVNFFKSRTFRYLPYEVKLIGRDLDGLLTYTPYASIMVTKEILTATIRTSKDFALTFENIKQTFVYPFHKRFTFSTFQMIMLTFEWLFKQSFHFTLDWVITKSFRFTKSWIRFDPLSSKYSVLGIIMIIFSFNFTSCNLFYNSLKSRN